MRIDYLSASLLPSEKANAVHVMKMAQAFAENGHDVRLFGRGVEAASSDIFKFYDVKPVFSLCLTPPYLKPSVFFRCMTWLQAQGKRSAGLVYGRDLWTLLFAAIMGAEIIVEMHQMPLAVPEKIVWHFLLGQKRLKHIVSITQALKQDVLEEYKNFSADKIVVAPDAADEILWEKISSLPHWPGRQGVPQIGYTGSLHKGRGVEIIEALAQEMPDLDFHIVGGTRETNLPNLFYHGHQPHGDMPRYLQKFDIVLAPYQPRIEIGTGADISRWISPMKLFEYMAAGKAIICSDLPVMREVLTDGENALLVKADTVKAWREALTQLAGDRNQMKLLAEKALAQHKNHYTWIRRTQCVI